MRPRMEKLHIVLLFIVGTFRISYSACPRNEAQAVADDPTRVCRKSCTTDSDCSGSLKRCMCDDSCGLSCFNPDAECDDITGTLGNGSISYRKGSRKYDAKATYSCNTGYRLRGKEQRICRSNKQWSHEPPQCLRSCPQPRRTTGAYVDFVTETDVYEVGSVVSYKCMTGRTASGNENRTCLASYEWSTLKLQCILKDCGTPPEILDGDYTPKGKTVFGQSLIYSCNKGFVPTDPRRIYCQADGSWDDVSLKCQRVKCPPPPSTIKNGNVDQNGGGPWDFEDLITYQCNDGYLINGTLSKKEVFCNENGTWGDQPVCEADLNSEFNNELEGYTVLNGGTYNSQVYSPSIGAPEFGLTGSGVLRSVPFPVAHSQKVCMQVSYQNPFDSLVAQAVSGGGTLNLLKFPPVSAWRTTNFWLLTPKVNQTEVQLQFSSTSNVWIDKIKELQSHECNGVAIPKRVSTTLTTTTVASKTPSAEATSPETTTPADTSRNNILSTPRPTTEDSTITPLYTSPEVVTSQMTSHKVVLPETTSSEVTVADTSNTAKKPVVTQVIPTIPGRNGRPISPEETTAVLVPPNNNALGIILGVVGAFVLVFALAALWFFIWRPMKNKKPIEHSPGLTSPETDTV